MQDLDFAAFCKAYNGIQKDSDQLYRRFARHFGLSDSACWILYVLREENRPLSQTELCSALYLSKQTINSALKCLENQGVIRLGCAEGDRRSKLVSLTEAGLALVERAIDPIFRVEERAFLRLTEAERTALLALGQKYLDLLHEEADVLFSQSPTGG